MDNSPILDDNLQDGLNLSPEIKSYLYETARWGKFLGIIGFMFIGLFVLASLFMGSTMGTLMGAFNDLPGGEAAGAGIGLTFTFMLLITALIYILPVWYTYKFATEMQGALRSSNNYQLTEAFRNLKALFRFMGILTAVIIAIYGISIFFSLIFAGLGSAF